jgi:hypothetical protein
MSADPVVGSQHDRAIRRVARGDRGEGHPGGGAEVVIGRRGWASQELLDLSL